MTADLSQWCLTQDFRWIVAHRSLRKRLNPWALFDPSIAPSNVVSRTVSAFRLMLRKSLVMWDLLAGRQGFEPRYRGPERPGKRGTASTYAERSGNTSRHVTAFRVRDAVPRRSTGKHTHRHTQRSVRS